MKTITLNIDSFDFKEYLNNSFLHLKLSEFNLEIISVRNGFRLDEFEIDMKGEEKYLRKFLYFCGYEPFVIDHIMGYTCLVG